MARKPISLETLKICGLHEDIDDAIAAMERDVIRRPNVVGLRSVTIKVAMKPVIESHGGTSSNMPEVTCEVSPVKMPATKSMPIKGIVKDHQGESRIILNSGDPLGTSHPDQMNFEDLKEVK